MRYDINYVIVIRYNLMNKLIVLLLVAAVSAEIINAENELKGPATEFITGLLKGLNEEKSIEHLKDCMKNIDEILIKIKEAFDLIKKMTYHDIINGIKIIIEIYNNLYRNTHFQQSRSPKAYSWLGLLMLRDSSANTGSYYAKFLPCD